MSRVLSAITTRMLGYMPPYWSEEPFAQAILSALGNEVQRISDRMDSIRSGFFPQNADDTYKILSLWEEHFGLPVNPVGATLLARQNLVQAHFQARSASKGSDWVAAMTQAMAGIVWSYEEGPAAYTITIFVPWVAGSYTAVQIETFARNITPAHLDVAVEFDTGFIVGEGIVGEDRL